MNKINMRKTLLTLLLQVIIIIAGSFLYTVGLELFLLPQSMIDGGITGVSIIFNHLTGFPLGIFIFVLNIPFLFAGYRTMGRRFTILTLFSVGITSGMVSLIDIQTKLLTTDPLLSAIFGGITLGIGVGLIIREGGASDGTEIIAIHVDRRSGFSVGQIVMFFNIIIFSIAGFIFGWDRTMYSIVAYFIASKVIDITIQGFNEAVVMLIISSKYEKIKDKLLDKSDNGITLIDSMGAYSNKNMEMIFVVVSRLEIFNFKSIVRDVDKNALVVIQKTADVYGKSFE